MPGQPGREGEGGGVDRELIAASGVLNWGWFWPHRGELREHLLRSHHEDKLGEAHVPYRNLADTDASSFSCAPSSAFLVLHNREGGVWGCPMIGSVVHPMASETSPGAAGGVSSSFLFFVPTPGISRAEVAS